MPVITVLSSYNNRRSFVRNLTNNSKSTKSRNLSTRKSIIIFQHITNIIN